MKINTTHCSNCKAEIMFSSDAVAPKCPNCGEAIVVGQSPPQSLPKDDMVHRTGFGSVPQRRQRGTRGW